VTNFDGNDDGKIDLKEFEAMWLSFLRERMVDSFQELDADGDAAVTVIEFQNPTNHIFDRLDRDNNGIVSQDEIAKLKHHRKGKGLMHKMHDDDDDDKDDDHS
ncbi:MAG: EF-hand domain-containing protein, partial [Alphaproteobacteria bacterium]|nr:EF-hand domain-containing protein [Alphaproteobacteria bacterium]